MVFLPAVRGWPAIPCSNFDSLLPMAPGEVVAENLGGVVACGHEPGQLQLGLV